MPGDYRTTQQAGWVTRAFGPVKAVVLPEPVGVERRAQRPVRSPGGRRVDVPVVGSRERVRVPDPSRHRRP